MVPCEEKQEVDHMEEASISIFKWVIFSIQAIWVFCLSDYLIHSRPLTYGPNPRNLGHRYQKYDSNRN